MITEPCRAERDRDLPQRLIHLQRSYSEAALLNEIDVCIYATLTMISHGKMCGDRHIPYFEKSS
jgi:hypothetical protein